MSPAISGIVLAIFAFGICSAAYVPGTQGAPWSITELQIVKAKLRHLYHRSLLAPQALRLGFHDCLLYVGGGGGCDGCLNWHNVDVNLNPVAHSRSLEDHTETDNNGLGDIVRKLERIYTEVGFPWGPTVLNQSLRDSGKSRADLWAYAAIVAVEFGVESNNIACDDQHDRRLGWNNGKGTCVHNSTEPGCKIILPRAFEFQTGRSDCVETTDAPYKAAKQEHHPSYLSNGRDTVKFFKEDFNFTGRETVAIFGAHTYGKPHFHVSQIPYTWTSRSINLFNNDYYKSLTGQDRWYFNEDECNRVGDAYGNKPKSKWITHTRMTSKNGGPIFWIHHNHACPNCALPSSQLPWWDQKCCAEAPAGMQCKADPPADSPDARLSCQLDGDDNRGCERLRFISGADEVALNCEIGLYFDFEVDNGIIHGCTGMEIFNRTMSGTTGHTIWSTRADGTGVDQPACPHAAISEPAGSTPTYKIMEEYANDQDLWIRDFIPAMEKMLANGYAPGDLTPAPDHYTNTTCTLDQGWKPPTYCYPNAAGDGNYYEIESVWGRLTGKVMTMDETTFNIRMQPRTGDINQQWSFVNTDGSQGIIVNRATNRPMVFNSNVFWESRPHPSNGNMLVNAVKGGALDCYGEINNHACLIWNEHGADWQRFNIKQVVFHT